MTSLLSDGQLIGPQQPRIRSVPAYRESQGPAAVEAAALAGLFLDPWQRHVLDDVLAVGRDQLPLTQTAALIVPRQNGKGSVIEAYVLEGLFVSGLRLITYTAHETKTADEMFDRMRELIQGAELFAEKLEPNGIRLANGQQQIKLKSGARLRIIARTKSSGRGFSGDRIILDEAQDLQFAHMRSMVPTLATRPDAHVFMAGSAPEPSAEVLPGVMARGRGGGDPDLSYMEWSLPDPPPGKTVDLDDPENVRLANPGYGIRLFERSIRNERTLLDDEGYARERLGIVGGGGFSGVINAAMWKELEDNASAAVGPVVFAFDVSPDQSRASICAAGERGDKLFHVEVIDNRPGVGWLVDRLIDLDDEHAPRAILLDPASPAGALLPDLRKAGFTVLSDDNPDGILSTVGTREYGQACAALLSVVKERRLRHTEQPVLATAVDAGRKRSLGDLWAWHRRSASSDITPLVGITLALHGFRTIESPVEEEYAELYYR